MSDKLCTEDQRFQKTLVFHCAPALAGIKPADLISWGGPAEETRALVDTFGESLAGAGVCLRLLCRRGSRSLILVYRRDRLAAQLARPEVRAQLGRDGYPVEESPAVLLAHLEARMADLENFPHEVGLFLGYPAADVEGFRLHRGRDYLYSGAWKVYADVEGAKRSFLQYRRCRAELSQKVASGDSLALILPSATAGC